MLPRCRRRWGRESSCSRVALGQASGAGTRPHTRYSLAPVQPKVAKDAPGPKGRSRLLAPEVSEIQTLEGTVSSLKLHLYARGFRSPTTTRQPRPLAPLHLCTPSSQILALFSKVWDHQPLLLWTAVRILVFPIIPQGTSKLHSSWLRTLRLPRNLFQSLFPLRDLPHPHTALFQELAFSFTFTFFPSDVGLRRALTEPILIRRLYPISLFSWE